MAIVEAASCGLQIVSTKVGGIPEVLPDELITLTEPTVDSVFVGLSQAISRHKQDRNQQTNGVHQANGYGHSKGKGKQPKAKHSQMIEIDGKCLCPFECNQRVSELYNWNNVSERTEKVYRRVLSESDPPLCKKLLSYQRACVPFILVVSFCYLLLQFLNWIYPPALIDIASDVRVAEKPVQYRRTKSKRNRI